MNSLTALERETVITFNDAEDAAHVVTWQRPVITKLRANPAAVETRTHHYGSSVGAEFDIPKALISFRSKRVTRDLTDEQRKERAARLHAGRLRSNSPHGRRESQQRLAAPTHGQGDP